jgi:hypothetical protein
VSGKIVVCGVYAARAVGEHVIRVPGPRTFPPQIWQRPFVLARTSIRCRRLKAAFVRLLLQAVSFGSSCTT